MAESGPWAWVEGQPASKWGPFPSRLFGTRKLLPTAHSSRRSTPEANKKRTNRRRSNGVSIRRPIIGLFLVINPSLLFTQQYCVQLTPVAAVTGSPITQNPLKAPTSPPAPACLPPDVLPFEWETEKKKRHLVSATSTKQPSNQSPLSGTDAAGQRTLNSLPPPPGPMTTTITISFSSPLSSTFQNVGQHSIT